MRTIAWIAVLVSSTWQAAFALDIHVATNGSDQNPGTKEKPFASLTRARDEIRALKQSGGLPEGGVTVWLGEGTYYLDEPLVFGSEDSGTPEKPIVYRGLAGQRPTLSGGVKIVGDWQPFRDSIVVCSLEGLDPEYRGFSQLFVNGKRQIRARYPNGDSASPAREGYISAAGADDFPHHQVRYDPKTFTEKRWSRPEEGVIHIFQGFGWGNMQWRIRDIDWQDHWIHLGEGGQQMGALWATKKSVHYSVINARSRYFIENIFEELDAPGEWYLDRKEGRLYYCKPRAIEPRNALFEVSRLKHLIEFRGTKDNPVRFVRLSGFRFAHTEPTYLEAYDVPSLGDWGIYRGGAICLEGAEDCRIENCFFDAVGGNGVFINHHARRVGISDNLFAESGDSAVCLAGKSHLNLKKTYTCNECGAEHWWGWDEPKEEYPAECVVSRNHIHHIGVFGKQTAGVFLSMCVSNLVSHNHIHHTPRAAICLHDGCWGGHIFEFNDVHDTVLETSDHGPFNAWGREPYWCLAQSHGPSSHPAAGDVKQYARHTTIIRNNRFRDTRGWGIDLDDGSSNYHVSSNLCLGIGIKLREGAYRTVENNIIVNPAIPFNTHVCYETNHDRIVRNIIVVNTLFDVPELDVTFQPRRHKGAVLQGVLMPNQGPWAEEIDRNLYFNDIGEFVADFAKRNGPRQLYNLEQWRELGYDRHSAYADPEFMDPAKGNFRVRPSSPALKLGFQNFPMDQFGLPRGYAATLRLSGADWRIHEDPDGKGAERRMPEADPSTPGWIPATVPGNIQADLEAAHELTPLWYGSGDSRMHEAARKDWWNRKDFVVPASFVGKRVTLVFDGVDHECEVFFNGRKIGGNAGMFKRFWFDVTEAIQPGQTNRLAVRIARMPEELLAAVLGADAPGGPNVSKASNAVRQRLKELKSPTNSAYDWAVAIYTLGIWKDVWLEATGPARLDWVGVQSTLTDNYSKASLRVLLDLDSLVDVPADITVSATHGESRAKTSVQAALEPGTNHVETTLSLPNPALWWPAGQGAQPLYELVVEVRHAGTSELLDRRTTRFGIREIRWEQTPGTPADFVNPLKLVVNGRPIRQMGSNLVPPDSLFGRMNARGPRLIELARAAGINCLRLWGGGVILSDAIYSRADELGIMLLQEFPLANCLPETDPVFLANLEATAVNIVKQVRNHPSIVEWSGGNEMPWKNGSDHPALHVLEQAVQEHDDRFLRATEPAQGSGAHGSYTYVYHAEPAAYLSWLGAGSQNLYQRYDTSVEMRISEFGTHSPANLEVWHRTIPATSQWPLTNYNDPVLIRKNVFWGAVLKENWLHKEITERLFGPLAGLEQLVQAGQFLGAEGLRYAMDALRRKGPALGGGFMSWNYNEPWPNGAGSYMIDYDGRPLMNYDFVKQALSPVSLSLKYASLLYDAAEPLAAQLFLVSDAPETVRNLRWQWLAHDRRGKVFAQGNGAVDAIAPQGVIPLETLSLHPPPETVLGPVFIELGLNDAEGRILVERLHVFGATAVQAPLAGLLASSLPDPDDAAAELPSPRSPHNLAWVGNGASPATASAELPGFDVHRAPGLNDGLYGNTHSWIGGVPNASFQIDLGQVADIGRFHLGRDRTGGFADRTLGELKIETSTDGQDWKTVFHRRDLSALPGYRPTATMQIQVAPVQGRWIRTTVNPANVCLDEFEVYRSADGLTGELPRIDFAVGLPSRPVARTTIQGEVEAVRIEGEREVLDLSVRNAGPMTALFCEPHPLIEYRTDLFIDNNHCFIPPGEARTITIRAARKPPGGLSLEQTGWRLSCWNADEVVIEPSENVLLAVGRRDAMCREFDGYFNPGKIAATARVRVEGIRPDPARVPYLLDSSRTVQFVFNLTDAQAASSARLQVCAADQAEKATTTVVVSLNGRRMESSLPAGLGIQLTDPAHLAFPAAAAFSLPAEALQPGTNVLEIRVQGNGWFSWDAIVLTRVPTDNSVRVVP